MIKIFGGGGGGVGLVTETWSRDSSTFEYIEHIMSFDREGYPNF